MAKVLGKPGRYLGQREEEALHRLWVFSIASVGLIEAAVGFTAGWLFGRRGWSIPASMLALLMLGIIVVIAGVLERRFDRLARERNSWQRGVRGEDLVGCKLEGFPDDFYVLHDVTTQAGNLDHVVVGPTGAYMIETKNWRGLVSADKKSELLLNGKPLDKPYVRQFVGRVMGIKERLKALAPSVETYFQPLFVFTSARVEANWGTTSSAHCIRDDQLYEYIVQNKLPRKLNQKDAETLARAFFALARMEAGFDNVEQASSRSVLSSPARTG